MRPVTKIEGTVGRILKWEKARIKVNRKFYKAARIKTFSIQDQSIHKPCQNPLEIQVKKKVQHPTGQDARYRHPRDDYDSSNEREEEDDDWPNEGAEQTHPPTLERSEGPRQLPSRDRHGRSQSKPVSQ